MPGKINMFRATHSAWKMFILKKEQIDFFVKGTGIVFFLIMSAATGIDRMIMAFFRLGKSEMRNSVVMMMRKSSLRQQKNVDGKNKQYGNTFL